MSVDLACSCCLRVENHDWVGIKEKKGNNSTKQSDILARDFEYKPTAMYPALTIRVTHSQAAVGQAWFRSRRHGNEGESRARLKAWWKQDGRAHRWYLITGNREYSFNQHN